MFENKAITAAAIPANEGTALKAIAWPELTARINAARDLRSVLRRDSACMMASFTELPRVTSLQRTMANLLLTLML